VGGTCGTRGGERCLQGFSWEAGRQETTGETMHRWEDNIKMDLKEIGIDGSNWIPLAPDKSNGELL
jgi:hypothetical protein